MSDGTCKMHALLQQMEGWIHFSGEIGRNKLLLLVSVMTGVDMTLYFPPVVISSCQMVWSLTSSPEPPISH